MTKTFLQKTTSYTKQDINLDNIKSAYEILSKTIKIPYTIHIIGTNGKGSTGKFLLHYLTKLNHKVVHFSSPHITKENERININGDDISDIQLQALNMQLKDMLPIKLFSKLTYFEHFTLLSFLASANSDFLILEAGLGGEFDATNITPNHLSLMTTIGLDHQEFLGDTISQITQTKARSCDKNIIVGIQNDISVLKSVKLTLKDKNIINITKYEVFEQLKLNSDYLYKNLALCIKALEFLDIKVDTNYFKDIELFGRTSSLTKNITLDVGHNTLGANEILKHFKNQKITLIYNSQKNKNYEEVLQILNPIISDIEFMPIDDEEMLTFDIMAKICVKLSIPIKKFVKINPQNKYLVFGSFKTISNFIKKESAWKID